MRILALDLGKYKTVACDAETGRHRYVTVLTTPKALHDLIVDRAPQRVVIEWFLFGFIRSSNLCAGAVTEP